MKTMLIGCDPGKGRQPINGVLSSKLPLYVRVT